MVNRVAGDTVGIGAGTDELPETVIPGVIHSDGTEGREGARGIKSRIGSTQLVSSHITWNPIT